MTLVFDVRALLTEREKLKRWGTGPLIEFGTYKFGTYIRDQFRNRELTGDPVKSRTDLEDVASGLNAVTAERASPESSDPSTTTGLLSCEDFDEDDQNL